MLQYIVLAAPISVLWVLVTGRVSPGSLLVGFVIGLATILVLRRLGVRFGKRLMLDQVVAMVQYTALIAWNGLVSSFQVTRLILGRRLDLHTGIVALRTGDVSESQKLAALSAHGINMTPGQLVIDFDDRGTLFVHCIDLEASQRTLETEQARRMRLLRRVVGEGRDE